MWSGPKPPHTNTNPTPSCTVAVTAVPQVGTFKGMIATPAEWADNGPLKQRLATQVITCHYADPVTMRAIHDLLAKQLAKAEGADLLPTNLRLPTHLEADRKETAVSHNQE